ncbi:HAD family hydrolase [Streptomyces sp. cmx-4-9]|uniref:HAD family hydrolase n=1 Tax=Streptomyces sp. cmx-4-9 TaxID=2790941 RepID=UPI00398021A2
MPRRPVAEPSPPGLGFPSRPAAGRPGRGGRAARGQRLALFDLDDTLVDRRAALAATLMRFADRHHLTAEQHGAVLARLGERAAISDFQAIRTLYGLAAPAEELWTAYLADMAALSVCPAEVLDGLDELSSRGWRLGIATNGPADIQHAKLEATGIGRRIHGVGASGPVGFRKPDPRLFAAAAVSCGATVEDGGWMVGNDPVKDIHGGRLSGLHTLWIGAPSRWPAHLQAPDQYRSTALLAVRLLLDGTS